MTTNTQPRATAGASSCVVSTQALVFGNVETSVFAVAGAATRPGGRAHIGIKFGRIIFYLEDRHALEQLTRAVGQAGEMATAVFGPPNDAFEAVELSERRRFERTR